MPAQGGPSGDSPGRSGPYATVEIDPRAVHGLTIVHNPRTDGRADPGEVVWTWVPYQERDGRGKDRPVLVVATLDDQSVLGVAMTSTPHDDAWDVSVGPGSWDRSGRPSWVRLERVFRLHQRGIRRAGVALDARRFDAVASALARRYGWSPPGSAAPRTVRGPVRRVLARLFGR